MYTLTQNPNIIIRTSDSASIPTDTGNADYQTYLAWEAEGNTPTPAEIPTPPPITLTARQFFIALANSGYVTPAEAVAAARDGAVPAAIAAVFSTLSPTDAVGAQITWAKMTQVSEDEPLIGAVAAAMSLDATHIHEFFVGAAAI